MTMSDNLKPLKGDRPPFGLVVVVVVVFEGAEKIGVDKDAALC